MVSTSSLLAAIQLPSSFSFDSACSLSSLSSIPFVNKTTLYQASLVRAGTSITFPNADPSCGNTAQVVSQDICRVTMQVETSSGGQSKISMEAWLPSNWTGRFLSTGNGGLAGCIQYGDMAYTAGLGFATVGANNGHNGTSGEGLGKGKEVVADFAYRSVHTGVVIGKQITEKFYGKAHDKSYYLGCSTGGRQGLKSVEDFPGDFDGVVAGSPASNFNALIAWSGHFYSIMGTSSSPNFVPFNLWSSLIAPAILAQCDTTDGVKDGIIEDPNTCNFDPSVLLCKNGATTNCLTSAQVSAVRKVYQPFLASDGKTVLYPRAQPGGESLLTLMVGTGQPFSFTSDWFKYVVYNSSFDPRTLTLADFEYAIKLNPSDIATYKGDLKAFQSRGGKLLTYHGQADGLITPREAEEYYDHAKAVTGGNLDDFYRFFRISGMSHCSGGAGAWQIGQVGGSGNSMDPDSNVLTAVVRWVEQGTAPEAIKGVKYVNDRVTDGVAFSRKHCRYPLRNTYNGKGNSAAPESWSCQKV